ncbi:DUF4834 family protein [Fulvivirga sedimenti]|uniref:DUF4834 family protein n=1 Tax=Fulvivirga sedimenti TaxID=2879465 RepID=A0A9X1HMS8_9BACT|nr:DUF4834 family protein [Fulvivirga sedimenti]MCA6074366.1 DUF4834 family protein [Fulvivirga sedimenti]
MFKFLFIALLVFLVFFRAIGFLMRLLTGSSVGNKSRNNPYARTNHQDTYQRPANGNVNIDYVPEKNGVKKGEKFTGGEYVDFEEIE